MSTISGQGTQNYYPLLCKTPKDNKTKELNCSITIESDETMIVVGSLKIPENGVVLTINGELLLC